MSVNLAMTRSAHVKDGKWRCGDCQGLCMTYPDPWPGRKITFVICRSCERGDVIDESVATDSREEDAA